MLISSIVTTKDGKKDNDEKSFNYFGVVLATKNRQKAMK